MPIISVPKPLRERLGDAGSDALVDMLNAQGDETKNSVIETAKRDFEKKLTEEISAVRQEIVVTAGSLRQEIAELKGELRAEIQKSKSDTIKWMFIFWIGQIGAVLGILFAVFK